LLAEHSLDVKQLIKLRPDTLFDFVCLSR